MRETVHISDQFKYRTVSLLFPEQLVVQRTCGCDKARSCDCCLVRDMAFWTKRLFCYGIRWRLVS